MLNVNKQRNNLVLGNENIKLYGREYINDTICGIKFEISPNSFFQVNPVQTEVLYQKAIELAELSGKETVIDLYCGIGTISLIASKYAKSITGVEIVEQAIADAKKNAENNNIKNTQFIAGDAECITVQLAEREVRPDIIFIDPPRKGSDEITLAAITGLNPSKIVYISCNPATLARDLLFLSERGYAVKKVQPVDMFPNTGHVETVVLLSRKRPDDKIEIDLDLDEVDITAAESKATYDEIKAYVLEKYNLKVSSLYISQVKRKLGLEVGKNYNLPKSENSTVPTCPPEKKTAITEALGHFGMI